MATETDCGFLLRVEEVISGVFWLLEGSIDMKS